MIGCGLDRLDGKLFVLMNLSRIVTAEGGGAFGGPILDKFINTNRNAVQAIKAAFCVGGELFELG